MKSFVILFAAFAVAAFIGCSGGDQPGAGTNRGGSTGESSAATAQDYGQKPAEVPDPQASGGTTLKASTPYQNGGKTISQNLNPAPFMSQNQAAGAGRSETAGLPANRAMGTVDGPMDQPPAGIGPGMLGSNSSRSFPSPAYSGSGRKSTAGQNIPGPQTTQPSTPK